MSVSRLCKFQNLVSAWHLLACSHANYIINEPATRKLEGDCHGVALSAHINF